MKAQTIRLGPASVRVSYSQAVPAPLRGKVRELSSLSVDATARGQGFARALLDKVILDADQQGLALLVIVEPFDDSPIDAAKLADWYSRMGFERVQHEPLVMVRTPVVMH